MPITLLVAASEPIFRAGLRSELSGTGSILVVGEAGSGDEALALAARLRPDVLLLDMAIRGTTAFTVIAGLRRRSPNTRVLALGASASKDSIVRVLAAAVAGFVLRGDQSAPVASAVEVDAGGGIWFDTAVLEAIAHYGAPTVADRSGLALTERELQVLELLAHGKSNVDMASALGISERTVRYHLSSLYEKLKLGTRSEVIAWAAAAMATDTGDGPASPS